MRLICPNCDAQYEVPAEVMPPEGRDVQCSNCGRTWFQHHPEHPSEATAEPPDEGEKVAADPQEEPEDANAPESATQALDEVPDEDNDNASTADKPAMPGRRELDPAVADVLRAEAELEAQARRNEAVAMESQPDLGLPDVSGDEKRRAREARERMAKMRGEFLSEDDDAQDQALAATTAVTGSRRDLLPDIGEINSTLRSNNDRSPEVDPGQTAQVEEHEKRSSRFGFSLALSFFVVLALVYVFAPKIAQAIPQAAPMLETFVSMVDSMRTWLETQMSSLLKWLDDAANSSGQ